MALLQQLRNQGEPLTSCRYFRMASDAPALLPPSMSARAVSSCRLTGCMLGLQRRTLRQPEQAMLDTMYTVSRLRSSADDGGK